VKVLLISPYPPERDGIGVYSATISAELVEQGHEVAVIAARHSSGARPEVIAALPMLPTQTGPATAAAATTAPDVVHVQFAVAAYGTWILSLLRIMRRVRGLGLPVVVTMHEITRDIDSLREVGRKLYRRVASLADHVILHTPSAQHELGLLGGDLPPSTVIEHFRAELPPGTLDAGELRSRLGIGDARVVLAFGFIDVDKGLDDLVVAAGRLKMGGSLDEVQVVVAGDVRRRFGMFRLFELRDRYHLLKIKRAVAALGLGSHIRFTGFVPAGEVRAYFDLAAVAVLPYR
jgi:glycosyltransferase involved in cell wall biosynthesis